MLDSEVVTLRGLVEDLCISAGIQSFDASELTDVVQGYIRVGRSTPRASIESLQQIYYFDAVEDAGVLKFVKRGGTSVVSIPEADTAAHAFGAEMPVNLASVFLQESELPHEVAVGYLEVESDYLSGLQYARRLTGNALQTVNIGTTVALSAAKARQVAEVLLWFAWMGRATFTLTLSRKYAWLKPTDVITVAKGAATHTLRVLSKQDEGGIITLTLVRENPSIYTQAPAATSMTVTSGEVIPWTQSIGYLLDIPTLRDADDGAGFYFSAAPESYPFKWGGAQLLRTIDGGGSWTGYGLVTTTQGEIGAASSVLANFYGGNVFDEINSFGVSVISGELTSLNELQVLSGGNLALLGDEIIQFKNAELTGAFTYKISGLLRGRFGTEWAMGAHTEFDRFVLLSTANTKRISEESSQIGLARNFKIVSDHTLVVDAALVAFTDTGVSLKPLAPTHVNGGRDTAGNISLHWVRRARVGGAWRDLVDTPLGESTELYAVDVMQGNTVARNITGLITPTTFYSAADQISDFGLVQDEITVQVYQISEKIGRGFPAKATISFPI